MNVIKRYLDYVLAGFCALLFAALVVLVTWQVFTRFALNAPSSFSEEMATFCFVWLVLFGAALVFGENGHMAMDFIKNRLPVKAKMAAEIAIHGAVVAFAGMVMVMGGYDSAALTWNQATGSIGVPLGFLYMALPISGMLIIFYSVHSVFQIVTLKRPLEDIPGAVRPEVAE